MDKNSVLIIQVTLYLIPSARLFTLRKVLQPTFPSSSILKTPSASSPLNVLIAPVALTQSTIL